MDFTWIKAFTWLDYTFLGLVFLGFIAGILRGALKEGYLLSGFILSFLASVVLSVPLIHWAGTILSVLEGQYLAGFLLLFLLIYIVLFRVLSLLNRKRKGQTIGFIARIFGGFFGLVKGTGMAFLFTWILMLQTWIRPEWLYQEGHKLFYTLSEYLLLFSSYYQ